MIIKRAARPAAHLRLHEDEPVKPATPEAMELEVSFATPPTDDEPSCIRTLLRPPEVLGLHDWGVPPEPAGPPSAEIQARRLLASWWNCPLMRLPIIGQGISVS